MTLRARTIAAVLLALAYCCSWAQSLEVIELKYRTAEEIIPVLQPLVEAGGALSGRDYTLFVRASAANLAQLRAAVQRIDRKPRQLLVSVRRSIAEEISREGVSASATIHSGEGTASANESGKGRSGVTIRGTASDDQSTGAGVSSVSVLEGSAAFISSGTSVPIVTTVVGGSGRHRSWAGTSTQYRDLTRGFLVTPRVTGDSVVLDIEQRDERVQNGTIQNQSLSTQMSARIGDWVRLGGIDESSSSSQSGILSRQYSTSSQSQGVWVKVEVQ